MLDKYLKIFGLDNNFSLDELEGKYKKLLKEFDTNNIEDDLKVIFLEEQVKIQEAHLILLKYYHTQEKVDQIKSGNKPSSPKVSNKKNQEKKIVLGISILLVLFIGAFIAWFSLSDPSTASGGGGGHNTETCDLVFKDNSFKVKGGATSKKNPKEIYKCFKEGSIKVGTIEYTLIKDVQIQAKREDGAQEVIKDDAVLKDLISSLKKANSNAQAQLVIDAISSVRNYNKLISDDGLEGTKHIWIWQDNKLVYLKNKQGGLIKIDKRFLKGKKKDIKDFLNDKTIPTSVITNIMTYLSTIDGSKAIVIEGCMDKRYKEYDRNATKDTKPTSCKIKKVVKGCMDKAYQEYNKYATIDNGSHCKKKHKIGCMDKRYKEYKKKFTKNRQSDCKQLKVKTVIKGCMDKAYEEYNPNATVDDMSCQTLKLNPPPTPSCAVTHIDIRKKIIKPQTALKQQLTDGKSGSKKLDAAEELQVNQKLEGICTRVKGMIVEIEDLCTCGKKAGDLKKLNDLNCN